MGDSEGRCDDVTADEDGAGLLADWLSIWQSEAACAALDPEWRDQAARLAAAGHALQAALAGVAGDVLARSAGTGAEARTAAAPPPSPPRGDALEHRLSELERQIAQLRGR